MVMLRRRVCATISSPVSAAIQAIVFGP